ncbi:MAG: hypothetical protein R6V54_00860 [Desulfobacteraceae bacterium]
MKKQHQHPAIEITTKEEPSLAATWLHLILLLVPLPAGTLSRQAVKRSMAVCCLVLLVTGSPAHCRAGKAHDIVDHALNLAREGGSFERIDPEELREAQALFYRMLTETDKTDFKKEWQKLNYSAKRLHLPLTDNSTLEGKPVAESSRTVTLLVENSTDRRGRGVFLFVDNAFTDHLLVVPHGLYDYHTSEIGIKLMVEGGFAAGCFNTVHRYGDKRQKQKSFQGTWDMADRFDTYFAAFARAGALAFPRGKQVQLHGFSRKHRKSPGGRESDMIISAGTRRLSGEVRRLRNCLRKSMPGTINAYPEDVQELGGTHNAIGAILRDMGHAGFLHMEMNLSFRNRLRQTPDARQRLFHCIEEL